MSRLLKVKEAAERIRFSDAAVYKALETGRMPGYKVLGRWRIPEDELEEWLEDQRPAVAAPSELQDPMPRPRRGQSRFRAEVVPIGARRRG